jgi:hypothetical protein
MPVVLMERSGAQSEISPLKAMRAQRDPESSSDDKGSFVVDF